MSIAPPRSRLSKDQRREHLLVAAGELLAERGAGAVTMEGVAAQAGVSKALPYSHFENAEALLDALKERELAAFAERVVSAMRAAEGLEPQITVAVHTYFDIILERGAILDTLLRALPPAAPKSPDRPDEEFFAQIFEGELGLPRPLARVASAVFLAGMSGAVDGLVRRVARRSTIEAVVVRLVVAGTKALTDDPALQRMNDYGTILVERDGPVAKVTLNRPDRLNAWTWQMSIELSHAFNALDEDDGVRAIVVTGAGRAFCAGADLEGGGEVFAGKSTLAGNDRRGWLERCPGPHRPAPELSTPIIAAINGAAVGAGLTMPIEWDIRYVADEAKLGFVFNRRGIMPDADLIWLVPRLIGFSKALDVLLTGRIFSGAEAAELGLVARSLPVGEVVDAAMEAAHDLAANTGPVSAAITKRLAYQFLQESDRTAAARLQGQLFAWTGRQPDAREGVMAFIEKRPARWKLSKTADLPDQLKD